MGRLHLPGAGLLLFLLWASAAHAFEPFRTASGVELAWQSGEGPDVLCASGSWEPELQIAAWDGALGWWTRGGLTWDITIDSVSSQCELSAQDGHTSVAPLSTWTESFGPSASTVGFTVHTWDTTSGAILDADIVLNEETFLFDVDAAREGSLDIAWVVGHEMGHALGLGHPCGDRGSSKPSCFDLERDVLLALEAAMMFPQQSTGDRPLSLGGDDLDAIAALLQPALEPADLESLRGAFCAREAAVTLRGEAPSGASLVGLRPGTPPHDGVASDNPGDAAVLVRYDDGRSALLVMSSLDSCDVNIADGDDTAEHSDNDVEPPSTLDSPPPRDCACSLNSNAPLAWWTLILVGLGAGLLARSRCSSRWS